MAALLFGLMSLLSTSHGFADDRSLFQATNAKPYVFFILDISGSMADTLNRRNPPMSGEDPTSKLYLAKKAAYEVIQGVGDTVNYGWATFNRERMVIYRKHWLYQTLEEPNFFDTVPIFPEGRAVVFGEPRNRQTGEIADSSGNFTSIDETNKITTHRYCESPTSVEDKILDFPKLGYDGSYTTVIYYEYGGDHYKITMLPLLSGNEIGAMQFDARVRIEERTGDCEDEDDEEIYTFVTEETLTFARFYTEDEDGQPFADFTDYIGIGRSGNDTSPFTMDDYRGTSACSAANLANPDDADNGRSHRWDGNYDGDAEFGDVVTYDVLPDSKYLRGRELGRGDMIPWDWHNDAYATSNREEIILRLAPNLSQGETVPDFRAARYFKDIPDGPSNRQRLNLKDEYVDRPPIISFGGTPIGGSMISFRGWYDAWEKVANIQKNADQGDPSFPCRQKYLILLTDGAETCESGSLSDSTSDRRRIPRETAAELYSRGIRTFAVAFGTTSSETASLTDIADEGGTGAGVDADGDGIFEDPGRDKDNDGVPDGPGPITAANKDELVAALKNVLQLVQPEATSISAAAVPSVQADVADKIYLTEFTPIDAGSVWPGSLQSFVKPLPLDNGLPDTSLRCTSSLTTGCLAWDAQEEIVDNQVKGSETDPLGFSAGQRRIFYSKFRADDGTTQFLPDESVPRQRRFLESVDIPTTGIVPPKAYDLWRGLGIDFTALDSASETDAASRAQAVTSELVRLRTETLPDGRKPEFVIGDFFHSDPLVINAPSNTNYFLQDLGGDPNVTCEAGDPKSYRCFALLHQFRRKMLLIGSNAGMLHAIDAGNYRIPPGDELVDLGEFDNGTGRELFAYVPRPVMPTLVEMMVDQPSQHKFTVDGPPVADDVFIDPIHSGIDSLADAPDADDREWRTVLMGGLRRGGSQMGDRAFSFGDILDPDVVTPDPTNPLADTDIQPASGYYLLDITQPDLIQTSLLGSRNDRDGDGLVDIWVPTVTTPENSPVCMGGADSDGSTASIPSGCGSVAFGTPLWEYLDLMIGGETAAGKEMPPIRLDEDDNGFVDLAFSWSKPVIGRLRVCTGTQCDTSDPVAIASGDQEDRYVAIFGGGLDPTHPEERGNWIYIVDIETGTTLYKQQVDGAVPASPAVVPTRDGYIDRIYFGTTRGFLYRLDMRPVGLDGKEILPKLSDYTVTEMVIDPDDLLGPAVAVSKTVKRVIPQLRADEGGVFAFEPQILFDVNEDTPLAERRSIYMSPSVFFVADLGELGIAFGTGNREDLFDEVDTIVPDAIPRSERFVVFVDDATGIDLRSNTFTPRDVDDLQLASGSFLGQNLLTEPAAGQRGWYLDLEPEERLIGDPLVISGVLFFSTFQPDSAKFVGSGTAVLCEESGLSRVYGTLVTNAEGVLADEDGIPSRNIEVGGLVTAPFAEQAQTKNPYSGSGSGSGDGSGDGDDDGRLNPQLKALMEELKELFPDNCTFPPGHRLDIKVRNQNTGLTFVVPVPICVVETAFREV